MKKNYENIAPEITRQRLLIEGYFQVEVNESTIRDYFYGIAQELDLRFYNEPIIFSPAINVGKEGNMGYDAFVPLIDSGISLYIWSKAKFLSVIIYTCKEFDEYKAGTYTKKYFKIKKGMYCFAF